MSSLLTILFVWAGTLWACSGDQPPLPPETESNSITSNTSKPVTIQTPSKQQAVQPVFEQKGHTGTNMDQGQKHPPLPADNPAWEWDAQSFVPDFGWYGEHSWADVRMRVVGHLAMAYRDLIRVHILNLNWDQASNTMQAMVQTLESIDTKTSKHAEDIRSILLDSAKRDLLILGALQGNNDFPTTSPDTLIHWRIEYWKLAQQKNPASLHAIENCQRELAKRFGTTTVSAIDDFDNFTDRHKLRSELFEAYVQSLDPLLPADLRWGYWRPAEIKRQAASLWMAFDTLKPTYDTPQISTLPMGSEWWLAESNPILQQAFHKILTGLHTQNPIFTPSFFSNRLRDQQLDLSVEQLGRLPTGDSIIDVGGQPGPMGIGTLMKLDVSDPDHKQWLTKYGQQLKEQLSSDPTQSVAICSEAIQTLNAYTHGSRFYNVKQFRNACTRQLARLGHYTEALTIFKQSFPLHHQDWACPNREGLLLVIMGRLEFLSGDNSTGITTLEQSIAASLEFLNKVEQAENGTITTPKPPMMKMIGPTKPNAQGNKHNPTHQPMNPPHPQNGNSKGVAPPNHTPHKSDSAP